MKILENKNLYISTYTELRAIPHLLARPLMGAGVCTVVGVLSPPPSWSSPARQYAGVAYRGESEGDSLGVPGPPTPTLRRRL